MKLIFCLGNPEDQYDGTRHNIGFAVGDAYADEHGANFKASTRFKAAIAEVMVDGEKAIIAKPQTYYNLVGESFRAIIDFYKIAAGDVLVIHDELALPFGTLRSRKGGSDAGNNGIKSINQHGGADTARLRIGIASEQRSVMGDTNFVLAKFTADEKAVLTKTIVPKALELIDHFQTDNHQVTSHNLAK